MTTITRRNVRPPTSNSGGAYSDSASSATYQNNEDERDNHARDDERDSDDDKDTRLTLMEEVLLLGLKDREVCRLKQRKKKHQLNFCYFYRVIHHSGMIVYHLVYVVVF